LERRSRLSLAWRIGLSILLVEGAVLAGLGFVYTSRFADAVDARVEAQALLPGRLFNTGVLGFESISDAGIMEKVIGERLDVGLIVNAAGTILLSMDASLVGRQASDIDFVDQGLLLQAAAGPALQHREGIVTAVTPIYAADQSAPRFISYVEIDTSGALAEKRRNRDLFIGGSFATLLVTSLIIFLSFRLLVLRRLNRAVDALGRFEGGNLSARVVASRTGDEVSVLESGINSMAARIEKTVAQLAASLDRTERTFDATVQVLATTAATRDPYTEAHQRRVAELSAKIGERLSLSAEQMKGLRVSAFLHDIGKISVPTEILTKPKRLTDIEFSLIKSHPVVAYDILRRVDFPWPVATIVRQHHERLDGSGYPDGISGDDILLEARILGVADVVEAMTTDRPYRAGLGMERALAEIRSKRSVAYDARVVDACLEICGDPHFRFTERAWLSGQ